MKESQALKSLSSVDHFTGGEELGMHYQADSPIVIIWHTKLSVRRFCRSTIHLGSHSVNQRP